jgi:hypothetical protein
MDLAKTSHCTLCYIPRPKPYNSAINKSFFFLSFLIFSLLA